MAFKKEEFQEEVKKPEPVKEPRIDTSNDPKIG